MLYTILPPKLEWLKTRMISHLTISEEQEFVHSSAGYPWINVSHEDSVKLSGRAVFSPEDATLVEHLLSSPHMWRLEDLRPHYVDLFIGLLTAWQLAFPKANNPSERAQEKAPKMEAIMFL